MNRRVIIDRWRDNDDVCVFNREMREWTARDDKIVELVLGALNANAEAAE